MIADVVTFLANRLTITVFIGYLLALWFALLIWTWFDISNRTDNWLYRAGALLLVLTGLIFGFGIYLLLRPSLTKDEAEIRNAEELLLLSQAMSSSCPNCHSFVRENFSFCPNCLLKLVDVCQKCKKKVSVSWSACAYCGFRRATANPKSLAIKEAVSAANSNNSKQAHVKPSNFAKPFFSLVAKLFNPTDEKNKGAIKNSKKVSEPSSKRVKKDTKRKKS